MSACVNDTNGDGDCAACARNPEAPCRVSARDRILRFAEENHNGIDPWCNPETGYFIDDWEAHLKGLLDAYDREQGEKIMAKADEEWARDWGKSRDKRAYVMGLRVAAKLITPSPWEERRCEEKKLHESHEWLQGGVWYQCPGERGAKEG